MYILISSLTNKTLRPQGGRNRVWFSSVHPFVHHFVSIKKADNLILKAAGQTRSSHFKIYNNKSYLNACRGGGRHAMMRGYADDRHMRSF